MMLAYIHVTTVDGQLFVPGQGAIYVSYGVRSTMGKGEVEVGKRAMQAMIYLAASELGPTEAAKQRRGG